MKKIIAMLLALTMVLALAACGGEPKETNGNDPVQQTTPVENQGNDPVETEPQAQNPSKVELTVEYLKSLPETPAEEFEYGMNWDDDGIIIRAYNGNSDIVVIPAEINGLPVKEIAGYVFANECPIRGILIPESVKVIDEVFGNNSGTELVVAEGVEVIAYNSFNNCAVLKQVKLGENIQTIEEIAFFNCRALEKLNISSSLTEMSDDAKGSAFLGCSNLTIYGEAGSFIEGVANELGIPFVAE
ncbi:MAG: leucine-rich repeat protein [Oscillospiraceae bacterium]|nr:leucine-rich repeat protein [Oscillospiraceae bacterium]